MIAELRNRLPSRKRRTVFLIVFLSMLMATMQCICNIEGACVGSGGVLDSPDCLNDWYRSECQEWDDEEINGSSWSFHALRSCQSLGYTEECSYGGYRLPGACR